MLCRNPFDMYGLDEPAFISVMDRDFLFATVPSPILRPNQS